MSSKHEQFAEAWRAAAADLGIRVTAPFVAADANGAPAAFIALVHDFGSPRGTLVQSIGDAPVQVSERFVSAVNPELYSEYDRTRFTEALEDWGWFGDGSAPPWYTGVSPWG